MPIKERNLLTGLKLRFISKVARLWATVDRFRYELVIDKDLVFKLFFKFQVILNDDDDEDDNDSDGNDDVQGGQMIITINE